MKKMDKKSEIRKYYSLPMFLIGGGSFVGVLGWLGLSHAAESIIFTIGSSLLSFSGSMTTLFGLMSVERAAPSKQKINKLKLEIIKYIKLQYPSYIITLENLKHVYQELFLTYRKIRDYCNEYRQEIRKLRSKIEKFEKYLQKNLKDNSPMIDSDSPDGIAKKIIWSDKQIQLTSYNETLEKLEDSFTSSDIERFRIDLSHIKRNLHILERGINNYRELMILCNQSDALYNKIVDVKRSVDKTDKLLIHQKDRLEELRLEMETKCEEAKVELSLFLQQFYAFIEDEVEALS